MEALFAARRGLLYTRLASPCQCGRAPSVPILDNLLQYCPPPMQAASPKG